ncbi:MAG: hypothetical protein HY851_07795 [candidate division Zixibacteria bacterium]|nr:hypothetical protein [candidate division Zixibacteria bacterium]
MRVNRPGEAIEAFKKVDRENTWAPFWTSLLQAHHLLGEHDKELEIVREGRRRFPDGSGFFTAELGALAAMGNLAEAKAFATNFSDHKAFVSGAATPAGSMRNAAIEMRAHGHEEEAMKLLDEAVRWYENQPPEKQKGLRAAYALTLYCARRWDKAKVIYEELAQKVPRDSAGGRGHGYMVGLIAARQGDKVKAMEVSEWLKSIKEPYQYGGLTYQRACIAAILGDKAQAVALLKECFLQGAQYGIELHRDFNLESLWDYPPFIEFLKPKG